MKQFVKGIYKRSIFTSDKGFVIGILKVKETNDDELQDYVDKIITFTGYFAELTLEDTYILYGETSIHPKYGFQFQVTESKRIKPEDHDGIIEFLSSDLFAGIGEKMAAKIVDALGDQALDQILKEPECLNLVPKLSYKKQKQIYDTLVKYEESHTTIVYLTELGFSMKDALSIYNFYKSNTIIELEHNIYGLIDAIEELNFPKIDSIALKMKIDVHDERRIKACLFYICKKRTFETGDTYLQKQDIYDSFVTYMHFSISESTLTLLLEELCHELKLVEVDHVYYLKSIYDAENTIVSRIKYLNSKQKESFPKFDKLMKQLEEENGIVYNAQQKEAILKALENHMVIITGGPGTGKTTIIKAIVEMYQRHYQYNYDELDAHVALLAPTGRASKRMSESTLFPATTIHRFLKWNKDNNEFAVNEQNPDHHELIIVDEVSMIDLELFYHLLSGLTNQIQLILVGDYNQLPSVGPGQVLKDFLDSKTIETVSLELLYRQSEESYIPILAEEIRNNTLSEQYLKTTNDYTFLKCIKESIATNLEHLCEQLIQKGYDYKRVQMMAPMYGGLNGIDELNKKLQAILNPKEEIKREIRYGDVIFREQDKVLQLVNMPDENVFNGDLGVIDCIIPAEQSKSHKNEIYVDFDGLRVKYLPKDLNKIKHGFMISIHKSQGSEFEIVVIPIASNYARMLYRKLIYTGITRAKRKLILIGETDAFVRAVENNNERSRQTNLCHKLKE